MQNGEYEDEEEYYWSEHDEFDDEDENYEDSDERMEEVSDVGLGKDTRVGTKRDVSDTGTSLSRASAKARTEEKASDKGKKPQHVHKKREADGF